MNVLTKQMMRDGKNGILGTRQKYDGLEHHQSDWSGYMYQSLISWIHVRFSPLNACLAATTKSSSWPAKLYCLLPLPKVLLYEKLVKHKQTFSL